MRIAGAVQHRYDDAQQVFTGSLQMKGRGALSNRSGRYEVQAHEPYDDGWGSAGGQDTPVRTHLHADDAKSIIARNESPDIDNDQSINPYRGCEHGCVYCYARPTHTWLGHSAGLDFETEIYHKANAAEKLRQELGAKNYQCSYIVLGSNTDAYQPVERKLATTRSLLEVFAECRHPVSIITKSSLVERDIDILAQMASNGLANVLVSMTTLSKDMARLMEPRAATPKRRLEVIEKLTCAGIPTGALIAPVIPVLTDHELESIIIAISEAGARSAGYVLLRLPLELKELFSEWLNEHFPLKAKHVLHHMQGIHGGKLYRANWRERHTGTGVYAGLIAQRFQLAIKKSGMARRLAPLDCSRFMPPRPSSAQMELF